MATKRTLRARNRKHEPLTPAELQFLTGDEQEGANRFVLLELKYLIDPERIQYAAELIDRAEDWLTAERVAELRERVEEARVRSKYPKQ